MPDKWRNFFIATFLLLLLAATVICKCLIRADAEFNVHLHRNETACNRVSVSFPKRLAVSREDIQMLRGRIAETLRESPALKSEEEQHFLDAYAAGCRVQIGFRQSILQAEAIFTGGSYFDFHRLRILQGTVFGKDDMMQDKTVISESLAFSLFGSTDCIGKTIWLDDKALYVCGVAKDTKTGDRTAEPESYSLYVPYEIAEEAGYPTVITGYELLLYEPMKGFARKTVEEALSIISQDKEQDSWETEVLITS